MDSISLDCSRFEDKTLVIYCVPAHFSWMKLSTAILRVMKIPNEVRMMPWDEQKGTRFAWWISDFRQKSKHWDATDASSIDIFRSKHHWNLVSNNFGSVSTCLKIGPFPIQLWISHPNKLTKCVCFRQNEILVRQQIEFNYHNSPKRVN